jgi:hypothetical protein
MGDLKCLKFLMFSLTYALGDFGNLPKKIEKFPISTPILDENLVSFFYFLDSLD